MCYYHAYAICKQSALFFGNPVIHNKVLNACDVLLSNCAHCLKTMDLFTLHSFVTHSEASNISAMVDEPCQVFLAVLDF